MKTIIAALVLVLLCAAESRAAGAGASWRRAGHAWQQSGSQLFGAIGKSIGNDPNKRQEWHEVGQDFKEAGKDTGGAVRDTVTPSHGSSGSGTSSTSK